MAWRVLSAVLVLAGICGCTSAPVSPSANYPMARQHNEGYSLLYKLMSDESNVGQIFILQSANDSLVNLVRNIGATCQAAKNRMDDFARADPSLQYDVPDLPYLEEMGRNLQTSDDTNALLFSSGEEFEVRLIFTQAEAMNYATQLCRALGKEETDPTRKTFLTNLAHQCANYHDQLMQMLAFCPPH
ncbi:MAG TPA: hypothetical protein VMG59_07080 [Phycisphaerae bacterium]|nr:hypothetical protein [Phycisphaerae bacterium]